MSVDYDAWYESILTDLIAQGVDVSALQKGDERTEYRSAADILKLLEWIKTKGAEASSSVSTRTVAYNVRPTT